VVGIVKVASVLAATLLLTWTSAAGQAITLVQQPPVFRSDAALVALNVTVQDRSAKYVSGLQLTDFAVYEDGIKQDVRFFEAGAVPLDLIVLLDTSSSMLDKIDIVHEAASGFLKTLREGDRGAVVSFANGVDILQALTSDRALLEKAVRSTAARGATALNNAIYIALKQFGQPARHDSNVRRQAIVVLSDGQDTSSLVSFDDVLATARRMGVNIYTVGLQSRDEAQRQETDGGRRYFTDSDYSMKTLARETGAQSFFPAPAELKTVYSSIATELANQYMIGYTPGDGRVDGRFRRVLVQVVTRPGLRPRTRIGYTPDGRAAVTSSPSF
jgi:Ca-activated chloride channel family protein